MKHCVKSLIFFKCASQHAFEAKTVFVFAEQTVITRDVPGMKVVDFARVEYYRNRENNFASHPTCEPYSLRDRLESICEG